MVKSDKTFFEVIDNLVSLNYVLFAIPGTPLVFH
jgi:hypothetical protein